MMLMRNAGTAISGRFAVTERLQGALFINHADAIHPRLYSQLAGLEFAVRISCQWVELINGQEPIAHLQASIISHHGGVEGQGSGL